MLFNSFDFAIFFGITWLLHALVPARLQNPVLLLASFYAYSCWQGSYLLLVLFSGALDYWLGWQIYRTRKRTWLWLSLSYNLAILAYFKYGVMLARFFIDLGVPHQVFPPLREMPVGISFFTFQSMGYAMDLFRGRTQPARRILDYLLFVSFFAQMMCGPIERARGFLRQLEVPRRAAADQVYAGASRVLWGLFQKVVVADNLSLPVQAAFERYQNLTGPSLCWAVLLFAIQLYCDFCGYTDMALGMTQMLGLRLSENFRAPYLAKTLSDFWSRWNITLMAWFRDYLYFPLAGRSEVRAYLATLAVFTLSGLWHGAAWHFVLWGLVNGIVMVFARFYSSSEAPRPPRFLSGPILLGSLLATLLLFRAPTTRQAGQMVIHLLLGEGTRSLTLRGIPWEALLGFLLVVAVDLRKDPHSFPHWFMRLSPARRILLLSLLLLAIPLLGAKAGVDFLYLQF